MVEHIRTVYLINDSMKNNKSSWLQLNLSWPIEFLVKSKKNDDVRRRISLVNRSLTVFMIFLPCRCWHALS